MKAKMKMKMARTVKMRTKTKTNRRVGFYPVVRRGKSGGLVHLRELVRLERAHL
jgi:hypothetical protein